MNAATVGQELLSNRRRIVGFVALILPHAKPTAFTAIFDSLDRDLRLVVGRVRAGAD